MVILAAAVTVILAKVATIVRPFVRACVCACARHIQLQCRRAPMRLRRRRSFPPIKGFGDT